MGVVIYETHCQFAESDYKWMTTKSLFFNFSVHLVDK